MRLGPNTITKRLFFSFGILVINIIVISFLALFFLWRTSTTGKIGQRIDNQRILIIQLLKTDLDFLRFETVNTQYYETGRSSLLLERDSLFHEIQRENISLYSEMLSHNFLIDYQFNRIDSALNQYNFTFRLLTQRINVRGFKDYGVEGTMREYAHQLESMDSYIALTDVLTLRRHEKDFLLRKEARYIKQFNMLADALIRSMQEKKHTLTTDVLQRYQRAFNQLTELNYEIGITPTDGLLGSLNTQTKLISGNLEQLTLLSNERKDEVIEKSAVSFSIVSFLLIIFSTVLTYYTSTRLARPIKKLSLSMGKFIVNEGLNEKELENSADNDEISNLSQSFIKLSRKLKNQFNEILQQNRELKKLNEELDRFIYSAAHDLKSPLASLDGLVHLAEREINSPQNAHYFHMMSASVRKLDGFIRDITDYAKNKRQQLKVEKIELERMIQEILQSVKFLPNADRVEVFVNISGTDFYTDRTRLEIIFKNLISNSFRYMDFARSNPLIKIEAVISDRNLRITVYDNGIGIGRQHLSRVFDMFYRAVEHSQGTGIGLFLVKESVKMLRGRISVKSSLGEWTVFYLDIPNFKHGSVNIPESEEVVLDERALESAG
jgi:signal transduction histidine kinase